jgi:hypothetical protein
VTDTVDRDVMSDPAPSAAEPHLGWAVAGLSAGAGVIHFAMVPVHASTGWQEPLAFALAGWFQLLTAGLILAERAGKRLYQLAAVANAAFIGVWAVSRTAGLPWGDEPGIKESVAAIDAMAVALQLGVVLLSLRILMAPERRSVGRLAPVVVAVAALGLATAVITSPDAAEHAHSSDPTGLEAMAQEIDETRCDTEFNIDGYWEEAETLGVDTRWAGTPPTMAGEASGDGHGHGAAPATTTATTIPADPYDGRGSEGLDDLVSATALAATSEIEAANLISSLSDASDEDYDAWLRWLRVSGTLAHDHANSDATFTEEDGSGHGGHVGPQPWTAMTNQEECDQLAAELELARETAMAFPTVADAKAAGYRLVAPYLPGIASHFIKGELIDGKFEIDKPEMILYDGNTDDAKVVGLSYYMFHRGENTPTQGFTGDNDSYHRHIGLCSARGGGIIGDSTTTAEECEARGGAKSDGSSGWMSHAWVVPGCESPWGVFSAATPLLDQYVGEASGTDGGACASSGVRDRYGMDDADGAGESASATADTTGN